MTASSPAYIAFHGDRCIATGDLAALARIAKPLLDQGDAGLLVFDAATSQRIDFDSRGSLDEMLARLQPPPDAAPEPTAPAEPPRGPGRPKLGVVAREVTLLPRHWEWLAQQRGGASVALRRLVDDARRVSQDSDRTRLAQESAYRFLAAMAGDFPQFEAVTRALFAGDSDRFMQGTAQWPADVRDHARRLAAASFARAPAEAAG
jgi:hypothetical protein